MEDNIKIDLKYCEGEIYIHLAKDMNIVQRNEYWYSI